MTTSTSFTADYTFAVNYSPSDSTSSFLCVNGTTCCIQTQRTPSSSTDTGQPGEFCFDSNYLYYCTATNTWVRAALSTW
jgi:hypothetical protein